MDILEEGLGQLVGWHDPDENRQWILENKPRQLVDKRMTVAEAVQRYVHDGDLLASGGFGHVRIAMTAIYEIIRQGKLHLIIAGKTGVQDSDLLIASGCVDRIEVAYAFGHELRGLSPASRRKVEGGECQVLGEISNAGYQWRFLAAMMGVPFLPARTMLGTDTLKHSSAKVARDPWSGKPVCLLPACYPDVALIHVSRCDPYGNAQVDGTMIEDFELARNAQLFGNVHGVYKPGNVELKPVILKNSQEYISKKFKTAPNPVNFVFHGGSGSEKHLIKEAIKYGAIKMNIDTDMQWAFWDGINKYSKDKYGYLQGQIGNPEGEDKPNKKYYDPRVWLRKGEETFIARLREAFEDLNALNRC